MKEKGMRKSEVSDVPFDSVAKIGNLSAYKLYFSCMS